MTLRFLWLWLLSYLPTKLPVGKTAFDAWADSILDLSGRYANDDEMKWALASMVIHADSRHGSLSKRYFVNRLRKAAANQVASAVFQEIKMKQQQAVADTATEADANVQAQEKQA